MPERIVKKILIIDDDIVFNETISEILKLEKFQVVTAVTAETGLETLAVEKPDIVLLDINLPDKNGFEVLKTVRGSKDFAKIPVVVITGDTTVLVDKAFDLGADDAIFKPVDTEYLIKRITKLILPQ